MATQLREISATASPKGNDTICPIPDPKDQNAEVAAKLRRFDQLDFDAYSLRMDMKLFRKLHCDDVKVVYPDVRTAHARGIEAHVDDIHNVFFNGTPDARITAHPIPSHPIAIGQGNWTAVTGVVEATFSEPMKVPGGPDIKPTGKKLKIPMVTVARWRNGCIAEEQIFFDNASYLKQLGLTK